MKTVWARNVLQPSAMLIALGIKWIDVTKQKTDYRGPVVIIASKRAPTPEELRAYEVEDMHPHGLTMPRAPIDGWRYGTAECVVDLVDVRPMVARDRRGALCSPFPGAMAWVLKNPRDVEPVVMPRGYGNPWRKVAAGLVRLRPGAVER